MKKIKDIIRWIYLLSIFSGASSFGTPINCNTSTLPKAFHEKFRIHDYRIDEKEGTIRIYPPQMGDDDLKTFTGCIGEDLKNDKKESVLQFLKDFALRRGDKIVVYLEVGKGEYLYPELFETLIVVNKGEVIVNLQNRSRKVVVKDDQNIREYLEKNVRLGEAFRSGIAEFFVYHGLLNSLHSLVFDLSMDFNRRDKNMSIDSKRAWVLPLRDHTAEIASWAMKLAIKLGISVAVVYGILHFGIPILREKILPLIVNKAQESIANAAKGITRGIKDGIWNMIPGKDFFLKKSG